LRKTVRRKVIPGRTARNKQEHGRGEHRSRHLRSPIGKHLASRETPSRPEAERHRWVKVASGDVTDRIGHGEHGQAECERNADEPDPDLREFRSKNRAAASPKHQQKVPISSAASFLIASSLDEGSSDSSTAGAGAGHPVYPRGMPTSDR
jgi:hypothetical protein